ncbi:hypothetical protein [Pseudarthrobacter sp. DSP2-3-2b1]|uniref:hypothetical protein n=1 Tax=Pseudarthrobacter sp. DSP2-3-2b1 TaxID=2804661 RepID=UPI003CED27C4
MFSSMDYWGVRSLSNGGNPFDFSKYNSSGLEPASSRPLAEGQPQSPAAGSPVDVSFAFGGHQTDAYLASHLGVPAKAPVIWLTGAIACAVVSLVVAAAFGASPALAISAWLMGGPVAIALIAFFSLRDTRARTHTLYSADAKVPWLYRLALFLSLAAVVTSALNIANWVGRL